MFILTVLLVYLFFSRVTPDNYTSKYMRVLSADVKHEPRFITFNTQDNGNIQVNLEFALPFITIPVKKTVDNAWDMLNGTGGGAGLANINLGALVIAGGMVFGAVVAIPFLSSLFMKNILTSPYRRDTDDEDNNEIWRIMTLVDHALIENNIDTTSCMQRTICWIVKNSRNKLNNGEATSQDKIIDGLVTHDWINNMIEGSAIQNAIYHGLNNTKCSTLYNSCKISKTSLQLLTKKIMNIF